jgi:ABC-2 type transport system ATP-binding protein
MNPHPSPPDQAGPPIEVAGVWRRFGSTEALRGVSLRVDRGEIHALLGPNGAGKTTLLRILTGLVQPQDGTVLLLGTPPAKSSARRLNTMFGLVPSGDRSFYLRISGLENLVFFARLHGLPRRKGLRRAWECLEAVDLASAARKPAGTYSHGMQKRLSVARALLTEPPILFVDEATHDLDPEGARRVQTLVQTQAKRGVAVVWATQRLDEIRGFADEVTLLDRGEVRFNGTVAQLMSASTARTFLLQLRNGKVDEASLLPVASSALGGLGTIAARSTGTLDNFVMSLDEGVTVGQAVSSLTASGILVLGCWQERSEIEDAFLHLTSKEPK